MAEGTPARIDRAALERIIQRAAELQAADHDTGERLTPEELVALGQEVGISGRHLHQAILEERTRIPVAAHRGAWNRLAGPAELVAQRAVPGDPQGIEGELVRWMERHELLRVQRRQPGRIIWEPIGGMQAAIRRSTAALGRGKRPFMLSRAETVAAVVLGLEAGYVHVTLSATARRARRRHIGGGFAMTAAGAGAAILLGTLEAALPVMLAPVPASLGLGYGILRRYAPAAARIQLGLECALDALEHNADPRHQLPPAAPGLFRLFADEVRKTLRP